MSANPQFVTHRHFGRLLCPWRRAHRRAGARAFLIFLPLLVVLFSPAFSRAQTSTLTVVDNEPVDIAPGEPGPGDNMVFSVRRNGTFVVSLAFTTGQPGEIVTHRLEDDGALTLVGRTPGGPEPRAIAMARGGDYAVVVNSIANEVVVMSVGDDGLLNEVSRTSSGGLNPYDVAVGFNDIVVVANRDSNQVNTFSIDRRGRLRPVDSESTGIAPHVLVASTRGLVAVANQTDRSVSLFELNRQGNLTSLGEPIAMSIAGTSNRMTPRTLAWRRNNLFVALDAPAPSEDVIRAFHVRRDGQVAQGGDTPAGAFLTDLEANSDGLFAVTVNQNGALPDRDEVRVYRARGTELTLDASAQTEGVPPSFKQVSTGRGHGGQRHVIVSEFQSGWLRSLIYDRRPQEEDEN